MRELVAIVQGAKGGADHQAVGIIVKEDEQTGQPTGSHGAPRAAHDPFCLADQRDGAAIVFNDRDHAGNEEGKSRNEDIVGSKRLVEEKTGHQHRCGQGVELGGEERPEPQADAQ